MMGIILYKLYVLVTFQSLVVSSPPSSVTIGALFTSTDDEAGVTMAFKLAVDYVNNHPTLLPNTTLKYVYNTTGNLLTTFKYIQSVCHQVEQNISILIGPASSTAVKAIYPITAGLHIPHIAPFATDPTLSLAVQEYPLLLKVNEWSRSSEEGLLSPMPTIEFPGNTNEKPRDTSIDLKNVTLKLVTIMEEPFVMELDPGEKSRHAGMKYKGYCIDLIFELQRDLSFNFTLHLVKDGQYGGIGNINNVWNGMVGEIVNGEADAAVGPLTITYDRQQAVEFTAPFMDLGLIILMAREVVRNDIFKFLQPFDTYLWYCVFAAFVICGVCTTACSYLSPYGFHGRYSQRWKTERQRHLADRNALNLYNGLWLSYASWMQQGTDHSPISFSGRLLHGVWWFAVMVISATYTANLAAFLTVARLDTGISSVADLADQHQIKYGTTVNSAPKAFFEAQAVDPYKKMFAFMSAENTWVENTSVGIQKVRDSYGKPKEERFAFIFDSPVLDHESHKPPCTTMTVGRLFSQIGYGIAFKKHSPYVRQFSSIILKLRSNGFLELIKQKWFDGSCPAVAASSTNTEGESTTLESMAGVFYLVLLGIGATIIALIVEICVASYRDTRRATREQNKLGLYEALRRRLSIISSDLKHTFCRWCKPSYRNDPPSGRPNGCQDVNDVYGVSPYKDPIYAYTQSPHEISVVLNDVPNSGNKRKHSQNLQGRQQGVNNPVFESA